MVSWGLRFWIGNICFPSVYSVISDAFKLSFCKNTLFYLLNLYELVKEIDRLIEEYKQAEGLHHDSDDNGKHATKPK